MIYRLVFILVLVISSNLHAQKVKQKSGDSPNYRVPQIMDRPSSPTSSSEDIWVVDSQEDWKRNIETEDGLAFENGLARPTQEQATFRSKIKSFATKRAASSIVISQSPEWLNWEPIVEPRTGESW